MKVNDVFEDLDNLDAEVLEGGTAAFAKQPNQLAANGRGNSVTLPSMPKTGSASKFSSWNTQTAAADANDKRNAEQEQTNFMDEVDELLLEQDLLSPTQASQTLKSMSAKKKSDKAFAGVPAADAKADQKTKEGATSPSPYDKKPQAKVQEKLRDSTLEKLLNGDYGELDTATGKLDSQQKKAEIKKKLSNSLKMGAGKWNGQVNDEVSAAFEDDEEFDLDNSDDLNRFINKYEEILTANKDKANKTEEGADQANGKNKSSLSQPSGKYNSASVSRQQSTGTAEDGMVEDEIDNLVDEELSRNDNSELSGDDNQDSADAFEIKTKKDGDHSSYAKKNGSQYGKGKTDGGLMNVKISTTSSKTAANGGQKKYGASYIGSHRSSLDDKASEGSLSSSQGSNGGESQMFKELFTTTNKQINKDRGIAGMISGGGISSGGGLIDTDDQLPTSNGGIKMVSDRKQQDLQIQAQSQEKSLMKVRSKKDLKNKFQSSAALYEDAEEKLAPGQLPDADKENKKVGSTETEKQPAGFSFLSQKGMSHLKRQSQSPKGGAANVRDLENLQESEIDEIIKQHLAEEEKDLNTKQKKAKKAKKKKAINTDLAKVGNDQIPDEVEGEGEESEEDTEEDYDDDIKDESEQNGKREANLGTKDDDDYDDFDYMDDSLNLNMKSPKLTLIEHLRLLADIFNSSIEGASDYYDQIFEERAQFMIDFDNILKIMTFDETVEYILPCMQIYSSEMDYLKLKLFQNLEKLFKKLFKAELFIPKAEIIDIITINIFPLVSRMLMLSEETVQLEGVDALLNLSKTYIPKDQAQSLMQKVISVIMDRISASSEHQESEDIKERAKIAVLIIVQRFAEEDIFQKEQCQDFLSKHLDSIQTDALFKIKKFLLPALIAISKHLDYEEFIEKVYGTFKQFNSDEIWGTRKVCIEKLAPLIKHIKIDEYEKFSECIDFFKRCLNDSNRWVKNQALIQFGPVVHEIFLKLPKPVTAEKKAEGGESKDDQAKTEEQNNESASSENIQKIKDLINKACLIFYDTKMIFGNPKEGDSEFESSLMEKLEECSFMQNKSDDIDKVKYYWAYNMPCAILVNGGQQFWFAHLKSIYEMLYKDMLINVRTAMSSGFKEIIELLDIDKMDKEEDRKFFVDILNHYLIDAEEISSKVLPTLCKLVSKFPDNEKTELLDSLIRRKIEAIKTMKNGRDSMISMLEQLFDMFQPAQLLEANFHDYLFEIIKKEKAVNYRFRAAHVLGGKIVAHLIKGKKYRALLTNFTDELRTSKYFRERQVYIKIAQSTYDVDSEIFKKHFAKNIATDMENEKCECVKIAMAKLCDCVKDGYSKSLDKIRLKLHEQSDPKIIQYMPSQSEEGTKAELERRYLAQNYGDEKETEESKEMTEEEWLEKEKKEIEEVQKTVNIRFANYTTLMKAQSLTQGLSAQLALFLTSMSKDGEKKEGYQPATTAGKTRTTVPIGANAQEAGIEKAADPAPKQGGQNDEISKKLLEKAGIKIISSNEKDNEAKKRSLSPIGDYNDVNITPPPGEENIMCAPNLADIVKIEAAKAYAMAGENKEAQNDGAEQQQSQEDNKKEWEV